MDALCAQLRQEAALQDYAQWITNDRLHSHLILLKSCPLKKNVQIARPFLAIAITIEQACQEQLSPEATKCLAGKACCGEVVFKKALGMCRTEVPSVPAYNSSTKKQNAKPASISSPTVQMKHEFTNQMLKEQHEEAKALQDAWHAYALTRIGYPCLRPLNF